MKQKQQETKPSPKPDEVMRVGGFSAGRTLAAAVWCAHQSAVDPAETDREHDLEHDGVYRERDAQRAREDDDAPRDMANP